MKLKYLRKFKEELQICEENYHNYDDILIALHMDLITLSSIKIGRDMIQVFKRFTMMIVE